MSYTLAKFPVGWPIVPSRNTYQAVYSTVGTIPGVVSSLRSVTADQLRLVSQCLILISKNRLRDSVAASNVAGVLLAKYLQRGIAPLPMLEVEHEALKIHGVLDNVVEKSPESGELGWDLAPALAHSAGMDQWTAGFKLRGEFILDPEFAYIGQGGRLEALGSKAEERFLTDLLPQIDASAGQWVIPQASLDSIMRSAGMLVTATMANRRVDFLVCHPDTTPFVAEIDGSQHLRDDQSDAQRDAMLKQCGIPVFRIPTGEIRAGKGEALRNFARHWRRSIGRPNAAGSTTGISGLVADCSYAAKIQYVFAKAVANQMLQPSETWEINIHGASPVAAVAIESALQMLNGYDRLYGKCSTPSRCRICSGDHSIEWTPIGNEELLPPGPVEQSTLRIKVEAECGPYHELPQETSFDFIIRPAQLPVSQRPESAYQGGRNEVMLRDLADSKPVLTSFLRQIFRKRNFLERQQEAVAHVLTQRDAVVLLPTGAGKSIIYQLAGMLMPGMTVVVDPLVALMEDQVNGLRRYGIDRALAISSGRPTQDELPRALEAAGRGEFCFLMITPERLQESKFRDSMRQLRHSTLINLGVIDEAHCVSEWGHDFRPAYLNLGHNLRRYCEDRYEVPPPILALTGTASRAVQNDMITELRIDKADSETVFRPETFDRPELKYEIVKVGKGTSPATDLYGVVQSLPGRFGIDQANFFRPQQADTKSGIIFVPTVNGPVFGICPVLDIVSKATGSEVAIYSGGCPKACGGPSDMWEQAKREHANRFLNNDAPILVATSAFGMGIDKANIRYTVHYGMPGSLEGFYQQAGRAGRDRRSALCLVIFSERDRKRSDELLDSEVDFAEFERRYKQKKGNFASSDDITRALYFYLGNLRGVEGELTDVEAALEIIGDFSEARNVRYPYQGNVNKQRKELAVSKLLKLGVIDDYSVSGSSLVLNVPVFDLERCKSHLVSYIQRAQPSESRRVQGSAGAVDGAVAKSAILQLARILIEFFYSVIEKSRRRMLQEAVLFAREVRNDQDMRRRLLEYLQEGLGNEEVQRLLDEERIDLLRWMPLLQLVSNPMDAGQLRGICVRLLESYPVHPGLLFARGVAEAMCSDHNPEVVIGNIAPAVRRCLDDHDMQPKQLVQLVELLYERANDYPTALGIPVTLVLIDLCEKVPELDVVHAEIQSHVVQLENRDVWLTYAAHGYLKVADKVSRATQQVLELVDGPSVLQLLKGKNHGEH